MAPIGLTTSGMDALVCARRGGLPVRGGALLGERPEPFFVRGGGEGPLRDRVARPAGAGQEVEPARVDDPRAIFPGDSALAQRRRECEALRSERVALGTVVE